MADSSSGGGGKIPPFRYGLALVLIAGSIFILVWRGDSPSRQPAPNFSTLAQSGSGWAKHNKPTGGRHPLCVGRASGAKFMCTSPTSGRTVECTCD